MSQPYKPKLINGPFDIASLALSGGLAVISTGLAIGAHLTPQDPPVELAGWIILWAAVAGFWILPSVYYFIARPMEQRKYHYITDHGVLVGWTEPEYAVKPDVVERITAEMLERVTKKYPNAVQALRGTVVLIREGSWNCRYYDDKLKKWTTRKVAGLQDGAMLYVGWREDMKTSALGHELCHRVLQMCAGDPDEVTAHKLMAELGIS